MDLSAIALRGLDMAQAKLERVANLLVAVGEASPEAAPVDTVDLSAAVVSLLSARNEFAANIKVLRTADDMQRQVLDLMA